MLVIFLDRVVYIGVCCFLYFYVYCEGPSGLAASSSAAAVAPPRSRGRPTIGPHQRTDLYGLPNSIYNLNTTQPAGPSSKHTFK